MKLIFPLLVLSFLHQEPATQKILVEGQVVNSRDRTPVPRGSVAFGLRSPKPFNLRIRDGRFSGEVPVGEGYLLMIWAPGFERFRANNVSVYLGMEPLLLELYPTTRISGRIVDPSGAGIDGARVAFALDPEGENAPISVPSREDGSFSMDIAITPGTYYLLVRHPLFEDAAPVAFSDDMAEGLRIDLSPKPEGSTGSIRGTATKEGKALSGAEVFLYGPSDHDLQRRRTDEAGAFTFADLAPGAYRVRVRGEGVRVSPDYDQVEVQAGASVQVDFSFEGSEVVSGTVFGPTGDPFAGVLVILQAGMTETYPVADTPPEWEARRRRALRKPVSFHGQTDDQGRFQIKGVVPGPYLLRLKCGPPQSDCQETLISVEIPAAEALEIVVEEGLEIQAVLLDGDGKVIRHFGYGLSPDGDVGSSLSAKVNSLEGVFVIRGLKPSTYSIGVILEDGRKAEALIDLTLGTNIVLRMPAIGEDLLVEYVRR